MKILILGGTAEARELAEALVALGHDVVSSLAGRTQDPILPAGDVCMGGFGGLEGLIAYLRSAGIEQVVDATHPYAGTISATAIAATQAVGLPLLRLERPAWVQTKGADWMIVESVAEAATALPPGSSVLLTTGHTGLGQFLERRDCRFVVRVIEAPAMAMPAHARLLQRRPPYGLDDELALLGHEHITHLVTKNSGGGQTAAKLEAARQRGVKVIMIARPAYGTAIAVSSVADAIAALEP